MLKNLIIIEGKNKVQCDTEIEVVKRLVDPNYYELSPKQKREKLKMKALANSFNNSMGILELNDIKEGADLENNFVLLNAHTYILSLLKTGNITLLERVGSNCFTKGLDKRKFTKNYIIVNHFANELLEGYVNLALSKNANERY